jgi:hypothetical protein
MIRQLVQAELTTNDGNIQRGFALRLNGILSFLAVMETSADLPYTIYSTGFLGTLEKTRDFPEEVRPGRRGAEIRDCASRILWSWIGAM